MNMEFKVFYDEEFDSLHFYKSGEKSKYSIKAFDNIIIDMNFENKTVGIEIHNASKVLNVSKNELKNIKEAKLRNIMQGLNLGVAYELKLSKSIIESQVMMPQSKMSR